MPDDDSSPLLSCFVDVLGMGACASVCVRVCTAWELAVGWPAYDMHVALTDIIRTVYACLRVANQQTHSCINPQVLLQPCDSWSVLGVSCAQRPGLQLVYFFTTVLEGA